MSVAILTPDQRIRVFLSSRLPEFPEERAALVKLIDEMGHRAVRFEATARPHPAAKLYRAYLAQSHIFIGIYGTGYGWIDAAAGMTISGLEEEWDLSGRLPRLVFIKETDDPREPRLETLLRKIAAAGVTYCGFKDTADLLAKARDAIAVLVAEKFLADDQALGEGDGDAGAEVARVLAGFPILVTEFLTKQLEPVLRVSSRVFVSGGPGAGKTTALFQLSQRQPRALYLSLRGQSVLSAYLQLNRRLASILGLSGYDAGSIDRARQQCEALLQEEEFVLLFDEADQAIDTAGKLAALALGKSRLVLAGRRLLPSLRGHFVEVTCSGFNDGERAQYLTGSAPTSPEQVLALEKSEGNPLYLRYYLESKLKTPASSLEAYHASMWHGLVASQREIIAICALAEGQLKLAELAVATTQYRSQPVTPIRVLEELEALGNIVAVQDGAVRIYHPAFQEFVAADLEKNGLAAGIHGVLAEAFASRAGGYIRIVHMARAGRAKEVSGHLIPAATWAEITGRIAVARMLVAHAIRCGRASRETKMIGLALLQAAHLQQSTGSFTSALRAVALAERYLDGVAEEDLALSALVTKGTFLAELGKGEEAEAMLLGVLKKLEEAGDIDGVAATHLNLGYVYVRLGRLEKIREHCEAAIAQFRKVGNRWGEAVATLNLQTYFIAQELVGKQIWCIRRLLTFGRELGAPRLTLAAYNGMISYYRRHDRYEKAEQIGLKAIALARERGYWEAECSNLGNLGNVYRDMGNYPKAREYYQLSLTLAENRGSEHHVAFSYELLASISAHDGDYPRALELSGEALNRWRKLDNTYRIATSQEDIAHWYHNQGKDFEAAKSLEAAARDWEKAGQEQKAVQCLQKAVESFLHGRHYGEAARCFSNAWGTASGKTDPVPALQLLQVWVPIEHSFIILIDVAEIVREAAALLTREVPRGRTIDAITSIAAACKHLRRDLGQPIYWTFLETLVGTGLRPDDKYRAVTLAIAIEQVPPELVPGEKFRELCSKLCHSVVDLRFRCERVTGEHWTILVPAPAAPAIGLEVCGTDAGVRAAVASAALLMWACRQRLAALMVRRKWRRLAASYVALGVGESERHGITLPSRLQDKTTPTGFARRINPQDETVTTVPMFVHEDFLKFADRNLAPENRCLVIFFGEMLESILSDFTHGTFGAGALKRVRRELICDFFALRVKDAPAVPDPDFESDAHDGQST